MKQEAIIRYAAEHELAQVNALWKTVNQLHAKGRPDIFPQDYFDEKRVYDLFASDSAEVVTAVLDSTVCGFAIVEYVECPSSVYLSGRRCYLSELGVSEAYQRMGIAKALIQFVKEAARAKGYDRVELDVWEFNVTALRFYNAVGFRTYKRSMELEL